MMINKYKLIEGIKKIKSIRYQMFIILILTKKDWKNLGMKVKRRLKIISIMVSVKIHLLLNISFLGFNEDSFKVYQKKIQENE